MDTITFEKNVLDVYSNIAKSFDKTRYYVWPDVAQFLDSLPAGSTVLDVGCGNGKNMLYRQDLRMVGCDTCNEFVSICTKKNLNVQVGNILNLPFNDYEFDTVISIAVIHHLLTKEQRQAAVKEMIRVAKTNIFIEVWADYEDKPKKFIDLGNNDYLVKWNNLDERYYHMYTEAEIDSLVDNILRDADNNCCLVYKQKVKFNWIIYLKKID